MRIFTKKAFQFDHPSGAAEPVIVSPDAGFAVVPDWVNDTRMFELALADGSLMVIESKQDEIVAEHGTQTEKQKAAAAKKAEAAAKKAEAAAKKAEEEAAAAEAEAARLLAEQKNTQE